MAGAQTVSFLAPQDQMALQLQQEQAQRQMALADALRQKSLTSLPTNQGPISPFQGFAQLAQAIAANHIQRHAMADQYSAGANSMNASARMMGAPGNVVDPASNPYQGSEAGRNLGQRIGDFFKGGAPISAPQQPVQAPNISPAIAPPQAAPSTPSPLPAPSSPGVAAAPPAMPASTVGGQPPMPMQGIMAPMQAGDTSQQATSQPAPSAPVPRSPLALTGDWRTNMMLSQANPEKYGEALIGQNTPTDLSKMMAQSGIDPTSALGHQILQANIAKQNYIAPENARAGSYTTNPTTGDRTYNAALPEGSAPQFNADGSIASVAAIPGAAGVQAAMSGAKAGGAAAAEAPYQMVEVSDAQGNRFQVPKASLLGGGAGAPVSGAPVGAGPSLNAHYGVKSGGASPSATPGNMSGIGPQAIASNTQAGKNSADSFKSAIDGGASAKDAMRGIDQIMTSANGLQTGTGAGALSEIKSGFNVMAGQVGLPKFDPRDIAAFDEIKKNAARLGDQLSQATGGGTDSRLKNALDTLPNANYSPIAIQEVGLNLKALQSGALGRSQAAAAWQQQNGPASYPAFQQAWQKAYNPDIFYHMQKGPQAFQAWAGGMSATARNQVLSQYRAMKTMGAF
jgi:hypothetical protein